jgi:two-component system, OmpR family, KDP operon response regulator KdpE
MVDTNKCVLVVDDEPGICRVLRIKLRLCGFDVITTTTGAEATELVRTRNPDIVLLDMLMPNVTGVDVLNSVRAFSRVPVIMFTGRPEIADFVRKLGANDCVGKPFNPDALVDRIRLVLGQTKAD